MDAVLRHPPDFLNMGRNDRFILELAACGGGGTGRRKGLKIPFPFGK